MKFMRFATRACPAGVYGLLEGGDTLSILRGGLLDPVEKTGETVDMADITRWLPPVDPPNILALGRNYREHALETADTPPKAPLLFLKATTARIGHEEAIVLPAAAPDQVDYEAELAVIIGRTARHVPRDRALDYVFGYTCGHDVSARDCQAGDGQWARAKSFDTFAPLGPVVATDIDPGNLCVRMRLNGETVQDQSTADMIFDVSFLISYLSRAMTLLPGTVIYTGTPSGVGVARKPPRFLRPGDVCEVDIEGIGVLRNRVVAETI